MGIKKLAIIIFPLYNLYLRILKRIKIKDMLEIQKIKMQILPEIEYKIYFKFTNKPHSYKIYK